MVSTRSQVYRDHVRYQSLFGSEVMVIIYTGRDVRQLFTANDRAALGRLSAQLDARPDLHAVITPLDAVDFAAAQLPIAPKLAGAALSRDQSAAAAIRQSAATGGDATDQAAAAAVAISLKPQPEPIPIGVKVTFASIGVA